jgi:UDPglucose 6-dehydrogenase
MKVNYFNMIKRVCDRVGADYENVRHGSMITGFIGREHTSVPGHDGNYGYGGRCFPENMKAFQKYLMLNLNLPMESNFIKEIEAMNLLYREYVWNKNKEQVKPEIQL